MNGPPSPGQETTWGTAESGTEWAITGPERTERGSIASASNGLRQ